MTEGNLGLVGAGVGVLALLIAAIGGGALVDELHNVKADLSTLEYIHNEDQNRLRLAHIDIYTKLNIGSNRHEDAVDYLLDKHAIHEKEIASLKKRLTKKPVVHEHRYYGEIHHKTITTDPVEHHPYEQPTSH